MKCYNCNNIISDQFMFCPHCGTNVNLDLANATEEAIYWYNKAQVGDADALNKVGIYYYQGKEGFPIDFEKAIKYFEKAASKGSVSASYNLAICYYKGHGVEINKPYAKTLLNYAKDNGHDGAAKALFKIEQEEHAEKLRIEEELRRQREKEEQERRRKEFEAYNERRRIEEEKRRQEQLRLEAERQKEEAERIRLDNERREAEQERLRIEAEERRKREAELERIRQENLRKQKEEEERKRREEEEKYKASYALLIDSIEKNGNCVFHDVLGRGIITKYDNRYIYVDFENEKDTKTFSVLDFNEVLKFEKTEKMKYYESLESNPYYKSENSQEKTYFGAVKTAVSEELEKCSRELNDLEWDYDIRDPEDITGVSEANYSAATRRTYLNTLHNDLIESSNNPYFARVDYLEDGKNNKIYVGKHQVPNYVIDWRDSRSSAYYQYQMFINNVAKKLLLMRDFDIVAGKYFGFSDKYSSDEDDLIEFASDAVFDARLLELLKISRSNHSIHDIIVSISKNQYEMVKYDYKDNVLINGCAGSGKTMILFHRLAHMAFNDPNFNPRNIYVLAPNRFLLNDFNELAQILNIDKINKYSWLNFLNFAISKFSISQKKAFKQFKNLSVEEKTEFFDIEKVDSCVKNVISLCEQIKKYFSDEVLSSVSKLIEYFWTYSFEGLENQIENTLVVKIREQESQKSSDIFEKEQKEESKTLADNKRCLEIFEFFKSYKKLFRGRSLSKESDTELRKISTAFIDVLKRFDSKSSVMNALEGLLEFFENKAGMNIILRNENFEIMPAIIRYCISKAFDISEDDFDKSESIAYVYLLVLNRVYGSISDENVYFCIDEYQNYSVHELMLINQLYPNATFNLYGDPKQTLSHKGVGALNNIFVWDKHFKEFIINENYRNAREITEYINKEFNMHMVPIGLPGVVSNIKVIDVSPNIDGVNRISLIYKNEEALTQVLLEKENIVNKIDKDQSIDRSKLNVIHISQAKGLEFEEVYVLPDDMNENEKYVAYTRALNVLNILTKI